MAQAGATQQAVLDRLRSQHGVFWGAQRLRDVTQEISAAFAELTQEAQVQRLLELLEKAGKSPGPRRPVLSVGRDGVTLREYRFRFFEHASVATVTVYDRAGGRLGTVYLAFAPEPGQQQMTERLTVLLQEVLRLWQGPLPRLTYVTDAGENETQYYRRVLARMVHPRTGEKLHWIRIVDYYHAAQRIWTMAEALFGKDDSAGRAWARRMCRVLKKPGGPFRMLHSAAALRNRRKLTAARAAEFRKAYQYIRRRTKQMQYHEYKHLNLPIGSGVTEAACKNGRQPTAEAFGDALVQKQCANDFKPASGAAQRHLAIVVSQVPRRSPRRTPSNLWPIAGVHNTSSCINRRTTEITPPFSSMIFSAMAVCVPIASMVMMAP